MSKRFAPSFVLAAAVLFSANMTRAEDELTQPILAELASSPVTVTSTVPPAGTASAGDVNPYGVAFVPPLFPFGGFLFTGSFYTADVLVSNFNNAANKQGTGSSIVRIGVDGNQRIFFQGPPGLGLTTALGAMQQGLVLAGSLPSTDGTCANITAPGSLLVLNKWGQQVQTLSDATLLAGPWDLTVVEENAFQSHIFVSNVLSGAVTRIDATVSLFGNQLKVTGMTQIASGFKHNCDPDALVVGPTGLAFDPATHNLYVASTGDNAIYSISGADTATTDAGKGTLVYSDNAHLRGPLALVLAPNGDLIAANGDAVNGDANHPSEMIEFTTTGTFVAAKAVDASGQGGAFGLALSGEAGALRFAAVDDVTNTLKVWFVR